MRGFAKLTETQAKLLLREPAALVWLALPVALVTIFGNIPDFTKPQHALHGQRVIDVYVPTIAAMIPLFLACTALPGLMASLREKDVLRRLAVSPVPAAGMLGALLAVIAALAAVGVTLIVVIGAVAFQVSAPARLGTVVISFVLGATAVMTLGLVVAAVARTGSMANGLGVPVMIINFFFSGLYFPIAEMSPTLRTIGEYVPFGAVMDSWAGYGSLPLHLAVLTGYTLVGSVVAARLFRWE